MTQMLVRALVDRNLAEQSPATPHAATFLEQEFRVGIRRRRVKVLLALYAQKDYQTVLMVLINRGQTPVV
jgi:hypothetical protein